MIRLAISQAAFEAITSTLPVGFVAFDPEANEKGERLIWLEAAVVGSSSTNSGLCAGPAKATATSTDS